VLHRSSDDDDGLQSWLAGHPGWPLPDGDAVAETTLTLRTVAARTQLHGAADAHARRVRSLLRAGDADGARRERTLLDAIRAELRA